MNLTSYQIMIIVAAASFFFFFLLSVGLVQYIRQTSKRREIVAKIKNSSNTCGLVYNSKNSHAAEKQNIGKIFVVFLQELGKKVISAESGEYSNMRAKFLRAGIRRDNFTSIFWGTKLLLAFSLPLTFLLLRLTVFKLADTNISVAAEVIAGLTGYYLPDLLLKIKTNSRQEKIQRALPGALDLLVVCVEAGMGMDAAIHRVAKEIQLAGPELADELSLLNLELRAGKARSDALKNLARRTNIDSIHNLVTMLIQTDKFGTSVAAGLKVFSDGFRSDRFQRAEEQAAKLPVKLLLPMMLFIFPSLFVVILGPAVLTILKVLAKISNPGG